MIHLQICKYYNKIKTNLLEIIYKSNQEAKQRKLGFG